MSVKIWGFFIYRKRLSLPYSFRPRNIIFHCIMGLCSKGN
nr:MAG TPA: hypothetical protein [Caudoviricetes sp.]